MLKISKTGLNLQQHTITIRAPVGAKKDRNKEIEKNAFSDGGRQKSVRLRAHIHRGKSTAASRGSTDDKDNADDDNGNDDDDGGDYCTQ